MIVVTAGHVDHGKSTLVRSITGTDPDRLPEERRRGLTIDLGFAFAKLPSGRSLALVDAPGHERFVRTMLSGCGGVDAALLVVSAREGWMPQTEEHLQILGFAGLAHGVVALTFADATGFGALAPVETAVRARLAGSFLERAAIVPTSPYEVGSTRELLNALDDLSAHSDRVTSDEPGRPRLWIDRSFTLAGRGRIVTGTLTGGSLQLNDHVAVVNGRNSGAVRIRSLHENGRSVATARSGRRVAVNVVGDVPPIERGSALVMPGQWAHASTIHGTLSLVRSITTTPSSKRSYRLFVGTTSAAARLKHVDTNRQSSDHFTCVRFRCSEGLAPVSIGDRYVLRDESTQETVGGGIVLAIDEQIAADRSDDLRRRADLLSGRQQSSGLSDLAILLVVTRGGSMPTRQLRRLVGPVHHRLLTEVGDQTVVAGVGPVRPTQPRRGVDQAEVRVGLAAILEYLNECSPRFATPGELARGTGVTPAIRQTLVRSSELMEVGPFLVSAATFEDLTARIVDEISRVGAANIATLRAATGLSRKYLLPLLESLDRRRTISRSGDSRVLPSPDAAGEQSRIGAN